MHFLALSILVQILCAVHCVRHGRSPMWLTVIIFLSIPGCIAYALFEILPEYRGRREVRLAKAAAVKKLDPERDVRAAREALELAYTAANCTTLADALAEQGRWREATTHYAQALAKTPGGGDRALKVKLARAYVEDGNAAEARDLLRSLEPSGSAAENDRTALLLARSLDDSGDSDAALALSEDLGHRLPGAEAQCRQAALLVRLGRPQEAVPLLEEAGRRASRIDRYERARDSDMYDWAARTLAELRTA